MKKLLQIEMYYVREYVSVLLFWPVEFPVRVRVRVRAMVRFRARVRVSMEKIT